MMLLDLYHRIERIQGLETNGIIYSQRGEGTQSIKYDFKNEQGEEKHEEERAEIRTAIARTNQSF